MKYKLNLVYFKMITFDEAPKLIDVSVEPKQVINEVNLQTVVKKT
jgi:hypothetical protein